MMIHSSNEGAQDPKDSFDLRGMSKLKLPVNIPVMVNWPPFMHLLIYPSTIRIEYRLRLHVGMEESPCMFPFRMNA